MIFSLIFFIEKLNKAVLKIFLGFFVLIFFLKPNININQYLSLNIKISAYIFFKIQTIISLLLDYGYYMKRLKHWFSRQFKFDTNDICRK